MRLYRVYFTIEENGNCPNVQRWARTLLQVRDIKRQAWEWHGVVEEDVRVEIVDFKLTKVSILDMLNKVADTW